MVLKNRVALITGAANGVGKELTEALLKLGNKVAMCDIDVTAGLASCEQLAAKYGKDNVRFYPCNVNSEHLFEDCFEKTQEDLGSINLVINNAGLCDETQEGWENTVTVNVIGAMRGSKLGTKYMGHSRGGKGGVVVNFSSVVGIKPARPVPVYGAAKAAVKHYTTAMGTDIYYNAEGVKFITICPGPTDTKFINMMRERIICDYMKETMEQFLKTYPPQRVENLVNGILKVIEDAPNGSFWKIQCDEPPFMVQ